jgi:hypothetical protein
MTDYRLTDLASTRGGAPRIIHGLATRAPLTFMRRAAEVAWEISTAALLDRIAPLKSGIREVLPGLAAPQGGSLALYLHWSPDARISAMVQRQIRLWRENGFDVVLITNAEQRPPAEDWAEVSRQCVLCIHRANVGRDFGGWRDGAALAVAQFGKPTELLLANDSVLGPFKPLAPLIQAWRAGGEGCFGMTESLGGGPHLQSYALLARGQGAVQCLLDHLADFQDSRSKWRVVLQGEIALSRRMQKAGHRCAAIFGYGRLIAQVDDATRRSLGPRFAKAEALETYPLNPCHHLWRDLIERMGFPYLKTELVRRNPGKIPGVSEWETLVPPHEAELIHAHLNIMEVRTSHHASKEKA